MLLERAQISTTLAEDVDLENITPLKRATRIADNNHLDGDGCGQSSVSPGAVNSTPGSALFEEQLWQMQEHIQLLPHEYFLLKISCGGSVNGYATASLNGAGWL